MVSLARIVGSGVLAMAVAGPALAADLPPRVAPYKAPAMVPYVAPLWVGPYFGLHAGYGWGHSQFETAFFGKGGSFSVDGALVGSTLGYNFRSGPMVYGIEGDLSYSWIEGTNPGPAPCASCVVRNNWQGTVRGRIGYAFNTFLPYLTGGVAFGGIDVRDTLGGREYKNQVGWTAGAGIEHALNGTWSTKLEYLYVDLGKFRTVAGPVGGAMDVWFHSHIVRVGINARF